jgi:hypothetical protein
MPDDLEHLEQSIGRPRRLARPTSLGCHDALCLRHRIELDLHAYECIALQEVGTLPCSWGGLQRDLGALRRSLVQPYCAEALRFEEQGEGNRLRAFEIVADDGEGSLIGFDPHERMFALLQQSPIGPLDIGIHGDPVRCYLRRFMPVHAARAVSVSAEPAISHRVVAFSSREPDPPHS